MRLIKDVAREAAERILDEHWNGVLPVDPVQIAHSLGMRVFLADLPENESGLIIKNSGESAEIHINRNEPLGRQGYTCAHELGHWVERSVQQDDEYSFVDKRDDSPMDAHEWYAEHFAANLLMPGRVFIEAFDNGNRVRDLAQLFGVSPTAAGNRMRNLGLRA
jgi:Zn-dependent peptidase ImmA (M78 family)